GAHLLRDSLGGLLLVRLQALLDRLLRLNDSPFEAPHARTKGADRQILDAYSPTALETTPHIPVRHSHATVTYDASDLDELHAPASEVLHQLLPQRVGGLRVDDQGGHDLAGELGVVIRFSETVSNSPAGRRQRDTAFQDLLEHRRGRSVVVADRFQ